MTIEVWLAFLLATSVLLAVPGPTVMVVVSYALGRGRRSGWATVPGVTLGDFTAMSASLAGAGAVLAASAELFMVLKIAGAAYLIWLGVRLWRAEPTLDGPTVGQGSSNATMFWNAYVVTALNPKSIVFFVAFVPQFINPHAPALPQFVILEATFITLAALTVAVWAAFAGGLRSRLSNPRALRLLNRTGAGFLIGAGVLTAAMRR